jgi:hypothetical protein
MQKVTSTAPEAAYPSKSTQDMRSPSHGCTVWVALGDYMGERMEVKGSSADVAAKHWIEAARLQGN